MPSIDIQREHSLGEKRAREIVGEMAESMARKFGMQSQWHDDALRFARPGVNGVVRVEPGRVHIRAELGFLLGALKPRIEQELQRQLDERFT